MISGPRLPCRASRPSQMGSLCKNRPCSVKSLSKPRVGGDTSCGPGAAPTDEIGNVENFFWPNMRVGTELAVAPPKGKFSRRQQLTGVVEWTRW